MRACTSLACTHLAAAYGMCVLGGRGGAVAGTPLDKRPLPRSWGPGVGAPEAACLAGRTARLPSRSLAPSCHPMRRRRSAAPGCAAWAADQVSGWGGRCSSLTRACMHARRPWLRKGAASLSSSACGCPPTRPPSLVSSSVGWREAAGFCGVPRRRSALGFQAPLGVLPAATARPCHEACLALLRHGRWLFSCVQCGVPCARAARQRRGMPVCCVHACVRSTRPVVSGVLEQGERAHYASLARMWRMCIYGFVVLRIKQSR